MIRDIQDKILKLKKEKGITILAHSYQAREILEVADFTGDSFQLSVQAQKASENTVLMCGVHFMAETVKILSPEKRVILSHPEAGCPMADQIEPEFISAFRAQNPEYSVVCYINTTAALKTVCDVCVTSSTAVKIVEKMENPNILFVPDRNLGDYVSRKVKGKNFKFFQGGCPTHAAIKADDVAEAKKKHPGAPVLVHPECIPAVVELADFVGSTSAIMDFAKKSEKNEFIIGTENSIAEHLSYDCPDKRFHALSKRMLCPNMKLTTLVDVLDAVEGKGGLEIALDADTIAKAKRCIDEMIRLGKD
jgi:quinolinate synthase